MTLLNSADKKCKALRQSNQLYTTADSEVMTLIATLKNQPQLATWVFQVLNTTTHALKDRAQSGNAPNGSSQGYHKSQKPAWFNKPPTQLNQTYKHDNRIWHWCPKCGVQGKWVCMHTAASHEVNFIKKRKGEAPTDGCRPSPPPVPADK
jgi:hypothetical protein